MIFDSRIQFLDGEHFHFREHALQFNIELTQCRFRFSHSSGSCERLESLRHLDYLISFSSTGTFCQAVDDLKIIPICGYCKRIREDGDY